MYFVFSYICYVLNFVKTLHMKKSLILTTLLFVILTVITSCKSHESTRLTNFYSKINKQMAIDSHLIDSRASSAKEITQQIEEEQRIKEERNSLVGNPYTSKNAMQSQYNPYKVIHDESEYANGDIYIQAAKRRQALAKGMIAGCQNCSSDSINKRKK